MSQNPSQPPRRRRRKPPRQQARDRSQSEQMVTRYDRLLDQWLGKLAIASKKIETYRKKVAYYRDRVATLAAAELAALEAAVQAAEEHAGRSLRHIELGEDSWESVPSTPSSPSSGSDHAAAVNRNRAKQQPAEKGDDRQQSPLCHRLWAIPHPRLENQVAAKTFVRTSHERRERVEYKSDSRSEAFR